MRILTCCQVLLIAVSLPGAARADDAQAHYRRGVEYGLAAQNANIFSKAGLARKAKAEFERAVQLDPDFLDARFALLEYDLRAPAFLGGGHDKAIAQASEIRSRNAVEGCRAFGRIYEHQKNYGDAAKEFEKAVALDPEFMPAWFEIGHIAAITGANLDRGEEALRKYLAHSPSDGDPPLARDAYHWLGRIFELQGKHAEARASYAAAERINSHAKEEH